MVREGVPHEILQNAWRANPHTYAQKASSGRWIPYHWLVTASRLVTPKILAGNARIIINTGPRFGKSEFFSFWLPTWRTDLFPDQHTMIASYSGELARDFGRKIRNELDGNELCITKLREDSQAADRWHTSENGGLVAAGVLGSLPGRGFNLGIIDDPTKSQKEAASWSYQRGLIEWFQSVFYIRREPNASIIIVMTRLDENDLCGWLMEEHGADWTVLNMPAIAGAGDILGRAEGEALCPERMDEKELASTRKAVGARVWESLYQQAPSSVGEGRAYEQFTQADHIDQTLILDFRRPLDISLDFNINPGMHILLGQEDARKDLLTAIYEIHGPRMDVRHAVIALDELVKQLGGWKQWPLVRIFGDATGKGENVVASESCYQALFEMLNREKAKTVRCVPPSNPSVRDSLDAFNDALRDCDGGIHYLIHPRCERLVRDMKQVKTDEYGLIDKRDRALSHASDAERYRISWLRPVGMAAANQRTRAGGQFNVGGIAGRIGAA